MDGRTDGRMDERADGRAGGTNNRAEFTTANLGKLQGKHSLEHMGAASHPRQTISRLCRYLATQFLRLSDLFRRVTRPVRTVLDPSINSNLCSNSKLVLVSSQQ